MKKLLLFVLFFLAIGSVTVNADEWVKVETRSYQFNSPKYSGCVNKPYTSSGFYYTADHDCRDWMGDWLDGNYGIGEFSIFPLSGKYIVNVGYQEPDLSASYVFGIEADWDVPPDILNFTDDNPYLTLRFELHRTSASDKINKAQHAQVFYDEYDPDDFSCMTRSSNSWIISDFVRVLSRTDQYPHDDYAFINLQEPNNVLPYKIQKFQIEVWLMRGCVRYVYERAGAVSSIPAIVNYILLSDS